MGGDEVPSPLAIFEPWLATRSQVPNEVRVAQSGLSKGGGRRAGSLKKAIDFGQ